MRSKLWLGFSLIEMLLVIAISAITGAILLGLLVSNQSIFYQQSSKVQIGLKINDALVRIRTYIKEAKSIANYPEINPTYQSSPTELVLKLASLNSSGNLISNAFDYVVYTTNQNILYEKIFPSLQSNRKASDKILVKDVLSMKVLYFDGQGLEVTPQAAKKVQLTLSLNEQIGQFNESSTATTGAYLRND